MEEKNSVDKLKWLRNVCSDLHSIAELGFYFDSIEMNKDDNCIHIHIVKPLR